MILTRLKQSTRHLHIRVEEALDLNKRLVSKESYAYMLALFYGLYKPLEDQLKEASSSIRWDFDLRLRMKEHLIASDLISLGLARDAVNAIPHCPTIPIITDQAYAFGCLYVLEGSSLGGQLIARLVEERLGICKESGCAFFTAYGDRTGLMWQEFCHSLTTYADSSPAVVESILSAANDTFEQFEEWFLC